ncbi:Immunoglobulin iota chain, partial [Ophiophagus hannah]
MGATKALDHNNVGPSFPSFPPSWCGLCCYFSSFTLQCHNVGILPPGIMVEYSLSQEPALSATLGEPATLSCNITGGLFFNYFAWYQHKGGESPRFILHYNTTSRETKFGPEASGHFSASTNTPKKIAFLTINNVQAKDEGDYYCGDARHSEEPQRGGRT